MADYKPQKYINCEQLLEELATLPLSRRQSFRSISLGSFPTDDHGNHDTAFQRLAAFLLDWKELEAFTIEMPDDINAAEKCDVDDYFWWGRLLPWLLLAAFPQGRWREVRLVHPRAYSDFPYPFLFHNMGHYVEEWILPKQPRLNCQESRHLLLGQAGGINNSWLQSPELTKGDVDQRCRWEWDRRGIDCRLEDPGPGEQGTVITIRWKEDWIQEERRDMVLKEADHEAFHKETINDNRFPWQVQRFPSFLRLLRRWQVVLCTIHGSCYTADTLQQHLIHFHGAGDDEANDVLCAQECTKLTRSWLDIIQPTSMMRLAEIRHLPLIQGYGCRALGCQYRGITLDDHAAHSQQSGPLHWDFKRMFLQTLSSVPDEIHYFDVYPQGDWLVEENAEGVMECLSEPGTMPGT